MASEIIFREVVTLKYAIALFLALTVLLAAASVFLPKEVPAPEPEATEETAVETEPSVPAAANTLHFTTTDLEGNVITDAVFAEHTLTILNFWEPWCGPCVMEMPDLQKLSQEYADRGVLILGIYATPNAEEDVAAVLERTGVTYPILHYSSDFDSLQTGYVPTTVIVDSTGKIVQRPFAMALAYSNWVGLIEKLL